MCYYFILYFSEFLIKTYSLKFVIEARISLAFNVNTNMFKFKFSILFPICLMISLLFFFFYFYCWLFRANYFSSPPQWLFFCLQYASLIYHSLPLNYNIWQYVQIGNLCSILWFFASYSLYYCFHTFNFCIYQLHDKLLTFCFNNCPLRKIKRICTFTNTFTISRSPYSVVLIQIPFDDIFLIPEELPLIVQIYWWWVLWGHVSMKKFSFHLHLKHFMYCKITL